MFSFLRILKQDYRVFYQKSFVILSRGCVYVVPIRIICIKLAKKSVGEMCNMLKMCKMYLAFVGSNSR